MVEVLLFHRSLQTFLTDHWNLNYVPQQFANLSQSDRIASYRGVALTQCCRIDCSLLRIPMEKTAIWSSTVINIGLDLYRRYCYQSIPLVSSTPQERVWKYQGNGYA